MSLKQQGINLDLSHIRAVLFLALARIPMPRTWRKVFVRAAGVNLTGSKYFIARDVQFDSIHPGNITIENDAHIAAGVRLLTHRLDTNNPDREDIHFIEGQITIGEHAFIGSGTIITGNVTIGRSAIIGAGSVVTKSVGDYEIWAGNPAKFIKMRA
ncbi:MAG: acyltransferase [Alistipes sp.]|jgi:acetyltransferase-like isoleucine patch superfamily enzyme|nr:acyltransferase [Alistipes sp.]